jgi:hypothetical protein
VNAGAGTEGQEDRARSWGARPRIPIRDLLRYEESSRNREELSMRLVDIDSLAPAAGGTARFVGTDHGANASFFVVRSAPGDGADKHRHP